MLAENIESEKFPGMVICLNGELGSGKTVFVKGFAASLGIEDNITSPTFTIVKEYVSGEMPLYHMDVYRIGDNEDFGVEDYLTQDGLLELPDYHYENGKKIWDNKNRKYAIGKTMNIQDEITAGNKLK